MKKNRFTESQLDEMYHMLVKWLSQPVIAAHFGCNKNTIFRYKKKFNLSFNLW